MQRDGSGSGEISNHFSRLLSLSNEVIERSIGECGASLGLILRLEADIGIWEAKIAGRPESAQLGDARRELGFATYAACCGLYRLAFSGLRTFLELSFASVYFSANELHRRQWVSDNRDFSWSQALDENSGVLSKDFMKEFFEHDVQEARVYALDAAKAYRHCSQFIHGKLAVTESLPREISFSEAAMIDWIETAKDAAQSVIFALYGRFSAELRPQDDDYLGDTLEHSFSHLKSVRTILGLPVEGGK